MYDSTDTKVITRITPKQTKTVVLTFDDGPSKVLPGILAILKQEKVPAVFFWQTRLLYKQRPWKSVLEDGHVIGTHTISHPNLQKLSLEQQYRQLARSVAKIETITGQKVTFFRPPFGQYNQDTIRAAEKLNLQTVMWRVASIDWELKCNTEQIIDNVVDHLEDGAIILLHELQQTVEALPSLIQKIRDKGYGFSLLK
ncbi:polysaccharide deacetylase family protein [Aquibacillus koreensis]|uniref:Polysaccharide deacetylase family protein n=1 Tax=Aquibacillus koreensis TaxID=279446 RepID=A0A9X3WNC1_9BACI|nr:polysaccharide deacetylase family protein [Aquibacillus koreensis]MCT2536008.1 polysaccharide deacetylase family protein [Aquibacillus koreensis]MDC3420464.1 polysaccharide deacetylase family protein [Aquibacillus koreensis]